MNKKTLILLAIIAGMLLFIYFDKCVCNRTAVVQPTTTDSLNYYKDRLNQETAAYKQREQDISNITTGYRDSIAALIYSKGKLLSEITILKQAGSVTITDTMPPEIVYVHDTVPGKPKQVQSASKRFRNPYYDATAFISLIGKPSTLKLTTFDTLRVTTRIVKERGVKYLQIDANNANPYNHITGLQIYRQPITKPKNFGIGLQAGYGFSSGLTPQAYIGVGISYNIVRF